MSTPKKTTQTRPAPPAGGQPPIDEEAVLAEIRELHDETPIKIGRLIAKLQAAGVYRPGNFAEYCNENLPIQWREAGRLIAHTRTCDNTRRILGLRPASRYVSRELNAVSTSPKWLKEVQKYLKARGMSIDNTTGSAVHDAVLKVVPKAELRELRRVAKSLRAETE
jgi:hypothetical protein